MPSEYLLVTPIVAVIGPLLGFAMLFGAACALMEIPACDDSPADPPATE
jgi:hypothetical protein